MKTYFELIKEKQLIDDSIENMTDELKNKLLNYFKEYYKGSNRYTISDFRVSINIYKDSLEINIYQWNDGFANSHIANFQVYENKIYLNHHVECELSRLVEWQTFLESALKECRFRKEN
jgi:hypothetical protein